MFGNWRKGKYFLIDRCIGKDVAVALHRLCLDFADNVAAAAAANLPGGSCRSHTSQVITLPSLHHSTTRTVRIFVVGGGLVSIVSAVTIAPPCASGILTLKLFFLLLFFPHFSFLGGIPL